MQFKFKKNSKAFTLLEILMVVGIISFIAGIVIIAINPGKQLANSRNTERRSDIEQIDDALTQYYLDHNSYPDTILGTLTEVCNTSNIPTPATEANCGSLINLSILVPTYLVSIPIDPQGPVIAVLNKIINTVNAAIGGTGYYIMKDSSNKIVIVSERAELGSIIAIGTTTNPFGGTTPPEEDPVFYTLTYDANGGSDTPTSPDIEEGSTITLSATEPTRSNYTFSSWNTSSDGTGTSYAPSASFTMPSADTTLWAVWEDEVVYTNVYYNAVVDTNWDTIGNWWTDQNYTTPLERLPIDGDTVYLDAQMDTGPSVGVTPTTINLGSINTASFGVNFTGAIGDAFFYNNSNNNGSHIIGNATFYDNSINNGWFDYSYGYYVDGTATFYENSINAAAIQTGIFHDSSYTGVSYVEFATFYDNSYNNNSVITNTAIFNNYSHNSYDISGTADFNGSSDMTAGTVNICNFNESSTYSAGTGCATCNGSVCPL